MDGNDRELLELAAKAAGYTVDYDATDGRWHIEDIPGAHASIWRRWNPLADDGDALRLAVRLGIPLEQSMQGGESRGCLIDVVWRIYIEANGDPYAATRRAIVIAASTIGRFM